MEDSEPHHVDIHVGNMVRARRRQLGVSQQWLGESIGITFQQIQKYERGANRISASALFRIAHALNVPAGFFFDGLDQQEASDFSLGEASAQAFLGSAEGVEFAELFLRLTHEKRRAVATTVRALSSL